ncbi:hypothetical protein [Zhongshania borealis]|uniref:Uncharacterized protein n=1 Tax=Zhongshania borealis TaxID=889488 RepID=A0ABP7WLK5_9GAMM
MEKLKKYILNTKPVVLPTVFVLGFGSAVGSEILDMMGIYEAPRGFLIVGPFIYFFLNTFFLYLEFGRKIFMGGPVPGNGTGYSKSSAESAHRAATMLNVTGVYYDPRK